MIVIRYIYTQIQTKNGIGYHEGFFLTMQLRIIIHEDIWANIIKGRKEAGYEAKYCTKDFWGRIQGTWADGQSLGRVMGGSKKT